VFLEELTDDELKKESKTEAKNDALASIIKVHYKSQIAALYNPVRVGKGVK